MNECMQSCCLDISEYESVPFHYFSHLYRQRHPKRRTVVHEGVELAILSTWIYALRQILQERLIEIPAGEGRVQLARIHTGQLRLHARRHHVPSERRGRDSPDRKQRLQLRFGHLSQAVRANIFEEQIAKRDRLDPIATSL